MSTDPAGFLLLTVPDCRIDTGGQVYTGHLALECVTIAQGSNNDLGERDIWLVIKIGGFDLAVPPVQPILHDRAQGVYTIPGQPNAVLRMPLAGPNTHLKEDLDTFEVLLAQYGVVHEQGGGAPAGFSEKSNEDFRGRLVLVDEADGQIVGEVGQQYSVRAETGFNRPGHEKDPVVVDLPAAGHPQEIVIHSVRPEEQDALMRGAHTLSRGIIMATNLVSTGMSSASNLFVNNTKPNEVPVEFSDRTRTNVKRVHKVSGKAVKVTAATTAAIFKTIDHVARYVAGPSRPPSPAPPPLPPRAATYAPAATPAYGGQLPPYQQYMPAKSATLVPIDTRAPPPPPLPARKDGTSGPPSPSGGYLSPLPMSQPQSLASGAPPPPPLPARKPRLLNRLLMATDLLVTTVEESGKHLLSVGTSSLSHGLGHRYGKDVGDAVQLGGETARNVAMVYIDARGVGHRALLRRAGKGMVKARFGSGGNKEVVFVGDAPPLPPR